MLVVISPAKKLDENCDKNLVTNFTIPFYLEDSKKIIKSLRKYSTDKLSKLMNISEKISLLNYERYIKWSLPFTKKMLIPHYYYSKEMFIKEYQSVILKKRILYMRKNH